MPEQFPFINGMPNMEYQPPQLMRYGKVIKPNLMEQPEHVLGPHELTMTPKQPQYEEPALSNIYQQPQQPQPAMQPQMPAQAQPQIQPQNQFQQQPLQAQPLQAQPNNNMGMIARLLMGGT